MGSCPDTDIDPKTPIQKANKHKCCADVLENNIG